MDWFAKRTEDSVNAGSRTHGLAVLDAVSELDMALEAMEGAKAQAAMKSIERLFMSEHEADRMEDKLCIDIVGGELSTREREDMIHFVRKMDQIANWAKEAALYVQIIIETGTVVPPKMWAAMREMSTEIISAVKQLIKAIEFLRNDYKQLIRALEAVIDQERIVDGLYVEAVKLAHTLPELDSKAVMLVRDAIHALEVCADECKSVADTINIIVISRGDN